MGGGEKKDRREKTSRFRDRGTVERGMLEEMENKRRKKEREKERIKKREHGLAAMHLQPRSWLLKF